jgi:ribosome-associated protein
MNEPLVVAHGVVVPADAIQMHAVRSGGPGGQNVNKVASKVELRIDIARIEGLDDAARERLRAVVAGAADAAGWLRVTSQRTRDQRKNLMDARAKVRELIRRALERPRARLKTRRTRASIEQRIGDKKQRARVKAGRRVDEKPA